MSRALRTLCEFENDGPFVFLGPIVIEVDDECLADGEAENIAEELGEEVDEWANLARRIRSESRMTFSATKLPRASQPRTRSAA